MQIKLYLFIARGKNTSVKYKRGMKFIQLANSKVVFSKCLIIIFYGFTVFWKPCFLRVKPFFRCLRLDCFQIFGEPLIILVLGSIAPPNPMKDPMFF